MEEIQQIELYLKKELTGDALRAFEQKLEKDAAFREEVNGYQQIADGFEGMRINAFEEKARAWSKELPMEESVKAVKLRRLPTRWKALAAAAFIGMAGLCWWMWSGPNALSLDLKQQYVILELEVNRGNRDGDPLLQATNDFQNKQYKDAIAETTKIAPEDSHYLYALYLKGHAQYQEKKYSEAISTFNNVLALQKSGTPIPEEFNMDNAEWTLILAHLAHYQSTKSAEDKSALRKSLQDFIQRNPEESYREKALELQRLL